MSDNNVNIDVRNAIIAKTCVHCELTDKHKCTLDGYIWCTLFGRYAKKEHVSSTECELEVKKQRNQKIFHITRE